MMQKCRRCHKNKEVTEFRLIDARNSRRHRQCDNCLKLPRRPENGPTYLDYIERAGMMDDYKKWLKYN